MKLLSKVPAVVRTLLGLAFFVFGLNGFLHFLPQPPEPEAAGHLLGALAATGYFFPLLKATEVVAGALLLAGRFVPLALTLLAAPLVNILAFHALLAGGAGLPLLLVAMEIYLAWAYRDAFAPMLRAKVAPRAPSADAASHGRTRELPAV